MTSASIPFQAQRLYLFTTLIILSCYLLLATASAQNNVLKYLELREIGATPAEIILSPDFQTIIEFEGMNVESASSGRSDQITIEADGETVRLRANGETVNTDLTVMVAGRTALFILRSDPSSNTPRRYVIRNSPPPSAQGLGYQGVEGKVDLNAVEVGTRDLPPGVSLDLTARMDNKGDVTLQYTLTNEGEVAIVNEPSRLNVLNEDIKLKYALSRVPPAGSVNVIRPGQSESGTLVLTNPPNGKLTFLWVLVQLGPGGQYAAIVDVSELLDAPAGTTATVGTPAPDTGTAPATTQAATPETAPATAPAATQAAPAPQGSGITLYTDTDFKGASMVLPVTGPISFYRAAKGEFGAVADNAVSSLSVPEGYYVLLCDLEATFPCQQYGPGSHNISADLNDKFSFAQVTTLPVVASQAATQVAATATPPAQPETAQPEAAQPATPANTVLSATFEAGYQPWELRNDLNATGKATIVDKDGQACVAIENNGAEIWSVQLVSPENLTLEAGHTYKLSFNAKADAVGQVAVNVGESVEPFASFFYDELDVDAADQPFTYTFSVPEGRNNVRLVFMLGARLNTVPNTVCFDNVTLQDTTAGGSEASATESAASEPVNAPSLLNTTFETGEESWELWTDTNQGANASSSIGEGNFCVRIEAVGKDSWSVNLASPALSLEAGHSYKLAFDAKTDNNNGLKINVMDVNEPYQVYAEKEFILTNSMQRHKFDFQFPENKSQLYLSFRMGGRYFSAPNSVCFDNIKLRDMTQGAVAPQDQAPQDQATQASAEPRAGGSGLAGTYALAAAHSGLCADVPRFSKDDGVAIMQWNCNGELNQTWRLEPKGEHYQVIAAHSNKCLDVSGVSMDDGALVQQWTCGTGGQEEPGNQLWGIKQVASGYQLIAKHSGKCLTMLDASTEPGKNFIQWPCSPGDQASNDVFALNTVAAPAEAAPQAQESSPDQAGNLLVNSSFEEASVNSWNAVLENGAKGVSKINNGEYCFNVISGGQELWNVRLNQDGFVPEPGQPYVLRFEAYANEARTVMAKFGYNYEPYIPYASRYFDLGTAKQAYALSFVMPDGQDPNSYLDLMIGGILATNLPFQTCFDNVTLEKGTLTPEEASTINTGTILGNGAFDSDLEALWITTVYPDKGGDGRGEVRNGEYCITVNAGGSERWAVRGEQDFLSLEAGVNYTLTFDAYASQPYTMLARVAQNYEPWHSFNEQTYELSSQKQTFSLPLSLNAAETNATTEFWLGGDFAANVPAQICLDNIKLTQ
jgi:hypothetical protein